MILTPDILKSPSVTVSLQMSEYRAYSILGTGLLANTGGGRFIVPRYDFRLTQALATGGGASEYNVSYIYVTRQLTEDEMLERLGAGKREGYMELERSPSPGTAPEEEEFDASRAEEELLELIAPTDLGSNSLRPLLSLTDVGGTDASPQQQSRVEWVFEGGRYAWFRFGGCSYNS